MSPSLDHNCRSPLLVASLPLATRILSEGWSLHLGLELDFVLGFLGLELNFVMGFPDLELDLGLELLGLSLDLLFGGLVTTIGHLTPHLLHPPGLDTEMCRCRVEDF